MRSKRIIANRFPGMESRVMRRWFEQISLFPLFFQKGNDSTSPIIRDGFLDPYNVDYVGQPLNIESPPILSSSAVMEQIPGARLFF